MSIIFSKKMNVWKSIISLCFTLLFCSTVVLAQQGIAITGTVTDISGTIPGVNVTVKGTLLGTVTDVNGKYQLTVPSAESVLIFSFVGYVTTEKVVGSQREINVEMTEDATRLEEVVVIGYGVLQKKLVTGATIQVAGETLQKMSASNAFTALQSQTPGVTIIQNNGQPGAGYIINIRGIGTNGNSKPLYVVDGVAAGDDALNHMSSADIESIDILKDAASTAIYGARAANGVVLITTKQGKSGKPVLTYNGYYGQQYMMKKPDMLTAKEYILIQNEMRFNENQAPFDWENVLPKGMYNDVMSGKWKGSDWVDAFYCKGAPTQEHSFALTGGNEYSKFSIGYSYASQEGILGAAAQSHYDRQTFRINSDHVLLKVRDMEAIKIGQTLNYNYRTNRGMATGGMYDNSFRNVLNGNPLLPIYNDDGTFYDWYSRQRDGWNFAADNPPGHPIGSVVKGGQGNNINKNYGLRASIYLQLQPIKGLVFKSLFGYNMSGYSGRNQSRIWNANNKNPNDTEDVGQWAGLGYNWSLDNTLTYSNRFGGHGITVQAGQAVEKWGYGENVRASGSVNIFDLGWDYAWVDNIEANNPNNMPGVGGNPWGEGAIASFFGRAMYNYKETYMATVILRADGSSNFARGYRWGKFPSVSAGWIITNESFMEGTRVFLDFLKLTANWGQNGNASIRNFQYISQYSFNNQGYYFFGDNHTSAPTASVGGVPGRLKNPTVTWEKTQMLDLGFDSRFLNSRLGVAFNYYVKDTKGWLLRAPISGAWGADEPDVNGGSVQNKGFELVFTWSDRKGDFTYDFNLNGSYNKNEVTRIENAEGIIYGPSPILSESTTEYYRLQEGHPMGFFIGYKTDGVFQNWEEVNAYKNNEGKLIMPKAQPGDLRFVDVNGDGVITPDDRTKIGCGWPVYRMGFTFNAAYKGFDFMVVAAGAFGQQIAKSYRSFGDNQYENFTTQVFERWIGEGTSNKWPRLTTGRNDNFRMLSDLYLENGNYVKIQNISVGYDFKHLFNTMPFAKLRLYFTARNLFTFTKYTGLDPEIGWGNYESWVSGIDLGYYPGAKTFLCGLSVTF